MLLDYADPVIGFDATLCLVACLLITPVVTVAKAPVVKLRWWYGMWVFWLGAAGLAIHLAYPPGSMGFRAAGNDVDWSGTLIVALLLPLAATSSAAAQRLLGPEWKRWQRNIIWVVWSLVGAHLILMYAWLAAGAFLGATLPGAFLRRSPIRRAIKAWRTEGYSTGFWWGVMGILGPVCAAGIVILVTEEVAYVAQAVTLAGGHH